MPTVAANGLEIAYETHGSGPPLVLLHGATSIGKEDFAAQIPLLSKRFQLILPDARGHGFTRWDASRGFQYDWLVEDLAAFTEAIGLETFHLLGFSMGAMTALQFATALPERLRTLVVAGISPQREPRASVARRLMDPRRADIDDPDWAVVLARRHDAGQGVGAWRTLLPAIAADVEVQPLLTPAELHAIDAPTMIACGDRDPFVPIGHAWALQRQLPDSRLFVAPDCAHEVMVRRPALFNEALSGFYRATEAVAEARADPGPNLAAPAAGTSPPSAADHAHTL